MFIVDVYEQLKYAEAFFSKPSLMIYFSFW